MSICVRHEYDKMFYIDNKTSWSPNHDIVMGEWFFASNYRERVINDWKNTYYLLP